VTAVRAAAEGAAADLPFLEALQAQIGSSTGGLAVMVVDAGIIGSVDALWGYHVGDAVRARAGGLLRTGVLREGDLLGEMGGDDIALVLGQIDDPAVAVLAAEKALRALNEPFWLGDEEVFARPSIGIALSPAHGDQAEVLLQRAKTASSLARGLPGRIATHDDAGKDTAGAQFLLANRLRGVVGQDKLEALFQPQYDLKLGQIMGAESLLSWPGTAAERVSAQDAFSAAESAGRVTQLTSSILNTSLRNISEFRYNAGLDLRVSISLPARALLETELPDVVKSALGTWSLRAGRLNLSITDTAVLRSHPVTRNTLAGLKALGLKLSVGDPQLAVSSLFWIAGLPFDEIRIDLADLPEARDAAKFERILRGMIELAHDLKLYVLVAGVEDEAAAERLKELGCDFFQAEFKGPALPPKDFIARYGFE
jgi:diguanylate cyclase (GGDEF)-like protein